MIDRQPVSPDPISPAEPSRAEDLGSELNNLEQDDEPAQAQTLANEALGRSSAGFALSDSEKVGSGIDDLDTPDLVDHMNQMTTSGRIDMSAFRGERNDDDEDGMLGEQGIEDDFPRGSE